MELNDWNNCAIDKKSTIYHLYEWGSLQNLAHNHKMIYLKKEDGIFPLMQVKSKIFGDRLISLPFADYGGPVTNDSKIAEMLISEAEYHGRTLGVDFIEIRSPDEMFDSIFKKSGFIRRDDYFTFRLALNQEEGTLWDIIGKKNRNMIRKAEKNNVKIIDSHDKSDLKIFYQLYLKTTKNLGSPPQPLKFFEVMWDLFYPDNVKIIFASYQNKFIACSLYFLYKDIIHHAYNCSLVEFQGVAPNNLIQWYIIKWGRENGYKSLDFGRTRVNAGNVLFKKRWGGELVTMPYYYKFFGKELEERQEIQYQQFSALWRKFMPLYFAEKIGPWLIKQIG